MKSIPFALLLASVAASIPPPCDNATETIVEIEGTFVPGLVYIFQNTGNDIYGLSNQNLFLDFVESNGVWQGCLPRDACFMAEVWINESTELDSITFKQDGKLVDDGSFYSEFDENKLFVEFGDCVLSCDAGTESLLELDIYVGRTNLYSDWWIQDTNGNLEIECDHESNRCIFQTTRGSGRFHRIRQCLPTNQCHSFIAGDGGYKVWQYDPDFFAYFNLTYGGELVARRDGFRFESIHFGSSCDEELACQNDEDAIFELFLFRRHVHEHDLPDVSFEVKDGANVLSQHTLDPNETLHYHRNCLPKDSSLDLVLSVPGTHNKTDIHAKHSPPQYTDSGEIQLVFDGVVYRDSSVTFGTETFNDTTSFGNISDTDRCGDDELLLEVFFTAKEDDSNYYEEFNARVQYMNDPYEFDRDYPVEFDEVFVGLMSGKTYRTTQCIPTDECTEFAIESNDDWPWPGDTTVLVNGEAKDERRQWEKYVVTTLGGENCPAEPLSGGAIAGIVIGSLIGVLVLVVVAKRIRKANDPSRRITVNDSNVETAEGVEAQEQAKKGATDSVSPV